VLCRRAEQFGMLGFPVCARPAERLANVDNQGNRIDRLA